MSWQVDRRMRREKRKGEYTWIDNYATLFKGVRVETLTTPPGRRAESWLSLAIGT